MQLRTWRKKRKLSLRELAAKLTAVVDRDEPCAASTVLMWETGRTAPSLSYAAAILKVTGGEVTLADLVRASEGKAP